MPESGRIEGGGMIILADDLSGAAEAAAAAGTGTQPSAVVHLLSDRPSRATEEPSALAFDLDTRGRPDEVVRRRVRDALALGGRRVVMAKVDSLLRGPIAATVDELRSAGHDVVACFALPERGRTVCRGAVFVEGVALRDTALWHAEASAPPADVPEALGRAPLPTIPASALREGMATKAIATALDADGIAVCDAHAAVHLSAIARAGLRLRASRPIAFVGTSALAGALAAPAAGTPPQPDPGDAARGRIEGTPRPILVVVGSRAPSALAQAERLVASGAACFVIRSIDVADAASLRTTALRIVAEGDRPTVLTIDQHDEWGVPVRDVMARLIADASGLLPSAPHLVLIGGDTARAVLDEAGVRSLAIMRSMGEGAVASTPGDGRVIVTRPGSFGPEDHLVRLVAALPPPSTEEVL